MNTEEPRRLDLGGQNCDGGWEAHAEHMRINGDCPWCGSYDMSLWLED